MVNARRTRRGIATQPHQRRPKWTRIRNRRSSTGLHIDRRLPRSTGPNRPSPLPPGCEVTRLLLETLNVHQTISPLPINPKDDIRNLDQLGTLNYISLLVATVETSLDSFLRSRLTHQQRVSRSNLSLQKRIERIQDRRGLRECPQHERPDLTASQALIQLQHYESLSADYESWSPDEPLDESPLHALCFASRAFGALGYKLPPDMSHEDSCLPLLIPLYDWHDRRPMGIMKNRCKQQIEELFHTYDSLLPQEPDQVGAPEE